MEVFVAGDSVILLEGNNSLWFTKSYSTNVIRKSSPSGLPDRNTNTLSSNSSNPPENGQDARLIPKAGISIEGICANPHFLGVCYGVVGKFGSAKLVVIRERELVGYFPGLSGREHEVYKINRVAVIDPFNINEVTEELIDQTFQPDFSCKEIPKSSNGLSSASSTKSRNMASKTWNSMKTVTVSAVKTGSKMVASKASNLTANVAQDFDSIPVDDSKEKLEKRLTDELLKMFSETDSFYYSPTGDLTNSIQRKFSQDCQIETTEENHWKSLDDRFFWNKSMLNDLLTFPDEDASSPWIIPVVQGYFQYEKCPYHDAFSFLSNSASSSPATSPKKGSNANSKVPEKVNTTTSCQAQTCDTQSLKSTKSGQHQQEPKEVKDLSCTPVMILFSRRSRFRAGTRYKKRGVDEAGNVGNYVETEQIFKYNKHVVSFVQVRGSIPIFWSQVGSSYRPPPKLDRTHEESQVSFKKHFDRELSIYQKQVIINLVESSGRERILYEAYLHHVLTLDSPDITYVSFDFHDYCRGMKFENVSVLIESLMEIVKDMKFTWVDDQGVICRQEGVFRVNCVDCLDRTNIVETAIARTVMDLQFTRLGLLPPEGLLPSSWRSIFQTMWANNGDVVSKQYAGTNALKSDFTRTGKTKLTGMMKDSYNSATRYYQNRFRDSYRQAVIDIMCDVESKESFMIAEDKEEEDNLEDDEDRHERVKQVIEDVKKLLIPEKEIILGGWPLIDCDPSSCDVISREMDTVLILTQEAYFVSDYDEVTDRVTRCQKILLEDIEKMELGLEPSSSSTSKTSKHSSYCIRIFYVIQSQSGYFHMFKSTGTRFFNNMAIPVKSREDEMESLKAIIESFRVALSVKSCSVPVMEGGRLERKKSRQHQSNRILGGILSQSSTPSGLAKSVGRQALSGMSSLLPLNKIKKLRPVAGTGSLGSSVAGPSLANPGTTFVYNTSSVNRHDFSQNSPHKAGAGNETISKVRQTAAIRHHDREVILKEGKSSSSGDDNEFATDHEKQSKRKGNQSLFSDSSEASDYSASIFVKEGEDDDAFIDDLPGDEDGETPLPESSDKEELILQDGLFSQPTYLESCGSIHSSTTLSLKTTPPSSLKNSLSEADVAITKSQDEKDDKSRYSEMTTSSLIAPHIQRLSTSRQAMHGVNEIKVEQTKRQQRSHEDEIGSASGCHPSGHPNILITIDNNRSTHSTSNSSGTKSPTACDSSDNQHLQGTVSMTNVNQSGTNTFSEKDEPISSSAAVTFFLGGSAGSKSMVNVMEDDVRSGRGRPSKESSVRETPVSNLAVISNASPSMKNSKSANEMVSLMKNLTFSSVSSSTGSSSPILLRKDLVLNPLSKIAKGVQSLGINASHTASHILSPNSSSSSLSNMAHASTISPRKQKETSGLLDSYDELKRRKRSSKTRIIEL